VAVGLREDCVRRVAADGELVDASGVESRLVFGEYAGDGADLDENLAWLTHDFEDLRRRAR